MKRTAILALCLIVPVLAVADEPPPPAIAARQAGFKAMGTAMKTLGTQLKSDAPDEAAMAAAAATIATAAREQGALFPAGSGPAPGVKTAALPLIWTERATFDADMAALVAESAKLVTATGGGDVAAIAAQVKATGAACGTCHKQFRADT
jgi:cytochrome c556